MKHLRLSTLKYSLSLMFLVIMGCTSTTPVSGNNPEAFTDANIAAIVVGANKIDISAANIALAKSTNPKIREFAQRMITDHQAVLDSATKLVTRLGVKPVNNDLVHVLVKQSQNHEKNLKTLSGRQFDKAYIDHEVDYHIAVIGVVKSKLIPNAKNNELKETLVSVLPAFDAHLQHSKMVQNKF